MAEVQVMTPADWLKRAHAFRVMLGRHTALRRDVMLAQLMVDIRSEAFEEAAVLVIDWPVPLNSCTNRDMRLAEAIRALKDGP